VNAHAPLGIYDFQTSCQNPLLRKCYKPSDEQVWEFRRGPWRPAVPWAGAYVVRLGFAVLELGFIGWIGSAGAGIVAFGFILHIL
jgi:hypothetical protein